jgi:hypothetical protein
VFIITKIQSHTLNHAQHNCAINHTQKYDINDAHTTKIPHFYWLSELKQYQKRKLAQNEFKKIGVNFDQLFKGKKLLIHKRYINKGGVELNNASNSIKIIYISVNT